MSRISAGVLVLLGVVGGLAAGCARTSGPAVDTGIAAEGVQTSRTPVGDCYSIEIVSQDCPSLSRCRVYRDNTLVCALTGTRWRILGLDGDGGDACPPPGADYTGDGAPNVVLVDWDLSARGNVTAHVLLLDGERAAACDVIDAPGGVELRDVDGDGRVEMLLHDASRALYDECSFGAEPAPQVILTYRNGRYRMAYELMRRHSMTTLPPERLAAEFPGGVDLSTGDDCDLTNAVVDLMYGGRAAEARDLLEKATSPAVAERRWRRIVETLLLDGCWAREVLVWNGVECASP